MLRRHFLAGAAALATRLRLIGQEAPSTEANPANPICVFTKPFQSLTYEELADRMAALRVVGIEATIRDGGHIEPSQVPDELPKLVEALRQRGLEITVMTSSINDPRDPLTASVLRVAAELGITRYRMKYFKYDRGRSPHAQIREWRPQLRDLAALNGELGIRGLYQNHAGELYLGSSIWDLAQALEGIATEQIAVAYDIRHATVEGGTSWPTTFRMIRDRIDTVYVKDFVWGEGPRPQNVPLGKGRVDANFFRMLADTNFAGPISLHEEYLDHRKPELVPDHLAAIDRDLAQLRRWLRG